MHLFQSSTGTARNYFPELGLREQHAPLLDEPSQDFFSPSRLASEILQFTEFRNTGRASGFERLSSVGNVENPTACLRFARVERSRIIAEDSNSQAVDEEVMVYRQSGMASEEGETGRAKGRASWRDMPKFILAGAVSTVISRTFVAPLERIKLECIIRGSKHSWAKMVQCILTSEGLRGFWKGNALNLFRMVPFKSINFICYDMYLDGLLRIPGKTQVTNHDRLIGGGISGITATVICLPLDTIRTRLIAPGGEALGGVAGCFIGMIRKEGFLSLYKGLTPALIGMGPSSAVFYGVYDILKSSHLSYHQRRKGGNGNDIEVFWTLVYGAIAGACAETVTYPLEVIRRQLQLQKAANLGLAPAFMKLIERDGAGSLFAGLLPSTLQVLPQASLSYFFYEMIKSILKIS